MDDKGIIFTTDALLALIIVTMVIGISINQFDVLNYQLQDFTGRQSLEKTVNDAADYLVKSPGSPKNWEKQTGSLSLPGLAVADTASTPNESNVFPISNYLDNKKIAALQNLQTGGQSPLSKLVFTNNYYLTVKSLNGTNTYCTVGNDPRTNSSFNNIKEIAVANRTVSLIPGDVLLQMTDLAHLNPVNPSDNPYLWYVKHGQGGKPAVYVGPSTSYWTPSGNETVQITQTDLDQYDFYIRIDVNQGGGSGVSSADYGFTDANWVVNGSWYNKQGSYNQVSPPLNGEPVDYDPKLDAINDEMDFLYNGWIKINNQQLDTGDFINVNSALQTTLNDGGGAPGSDHFRLWFRVPSDANADFSISLVRVRKGASLNKVPAQLVLMIWR